MPADSATLSELEGIPWRRPTTAERLRRDGRIWTLWTSAVVFQGLALGGALLLVEPWSFPLAALCFAWAWFVPHIQARRGARQVVPLPGNPAAEGEEMPVNEAERTALGLLGDLLDHEQRELAAETGLVMHRGRLGVWLIGEKGAVMVRDGWLGAGRRADCWCVRVAEGGDLPGGDRVAHLLLALREDEPGFATVANFGFSGAVGRVRRRLPKRSRPALDAARMAASAREDR